MLSLSALWDRTTAFVADHAGAILPIAVLGLFLPTAALSSLQPFVAAQPWLVLILLVCGLTAAWAQLALIALAIDPAAGKAGALDVAIRRLPVQIGISLLFALVVLLAFIPLGIAIGVAAATSGAAPTPGHMPQFGLGTALFVLVYGVLMAVAFVWIAARLLPWSAVIVAERRGLGSVRRAFQLTRGATLKLIGLILLYVVVSQVAQLAATTVIGAILGIFVDATAAQIVGKIFGAIVATAFGVLAGVYIGQLYLALRDRLDGTLDLR